MSAFASLPVKLSLINGGPFDIRGRRAEGDTPALPKEVYSNVNPHHNPPSMIALWCSITLTCPALSTTGVPACLHIVFFDFQISFKLNTETMLWMYFFHLL